MVYKHYSRLSQIEEKRNLRATLIYGGLSIVTLVILIFFGFPLIIKFSSFLSELGKSKQPIDTLDKTPPPPPTLQIPTLYTKEQSIQITGKAEPASTVKIFFNNKKKEALVDSEGFFSKTILLEKGVNTLYAIAVDQNANQSGESKRLTVIYDNEPPNLQILEPTTTNFYGLRQKNVTIKGKTDPESSVTVNEKFVVVANDGIFSHLVSLSPGENSFTIKASDQAGNATETVLTLFWAS